MKSSPLQRKSPMPRGKAGLKQGAPLQRRTELKPGIKQLKPGTTELKRTTPMPRSLKPLPAANKARQARKTVAAGMPKDTAQKLVRARSGGWCELRIPGVCLGRATNFAHIKPEGQGGLYIPSGLLHLCGMGNVSGCHGYQENHRVEAREKGWLVRANANQRKRRPVHMWARLGEKWVKGVWLLDDAGGAVPATNTGEAA